jgi:outer membrane receptor protein involved in Fe transport
MIKLFRSFVLTLIFAFVLIALLGIVSGTLMAQGSSGSVSGLVKDRSSNLPIEGADVTLHKTSDSSLVKGTATDADGRFVIQDITAGSYYLRANLVGYNSAVVSGISISSQNKNIVLNQITLSTSTTTTEEIVVESEKSMIEFRPDKKIFNVSKNPNTQGSTLIDLLKDIPAVTVDQDNNVSLRGSEGVKLLIDGRPSGLDGSNRAAILEQIQASDVESIELITNPSAKYEAEGSSGIINIIMKKNENKGFGYNGTVALNMGTRDKYSGQFSLNLKNNKVNVFGNYSYNSRNMVSSGFNQRYNYLSTNSYFSDITNDGSRRMRGHNLKLGMDYYVDQQNTIGIGFSYRNSERGRHDLGISREYDPSGNLTSDYFNTVTSNDKGYNFDISANYMLRFKTPQQVLTAEFSYSRDKDEDLSNTFDTFIMPVNPTPENRNEIENEMEDEYTAKIDYVHPFNKDTRLETGYKGKYEKRDNDFVREQFDYGTNQFETDFNSSNRFIYNEQIHGLYAIYLQQIGSFGFSLGARMEHTRINGELVNPSQIFDRNYTDFFPSASISQKLSKTSEIQLSYAKRVRRPRTRQLNPFTSITMMGGSNSLQQGNPNLNPEFTDSYELSFIQYLPFATVTPSIFYRRTKDEIARTITLIDSITTLTSFVNYNKSSSYGGEVLVNSQPFKFWTLNGTFSYYKTEVDASNLGSGQRNSGYTWSARGMTSFILPADLSMQLSYFYHGMRISAQGSFEPFQMMDVSVKKDLFDKKLSVSFRVSDVFNTGKFRANITGDNFTQIFERSRDSRAFFLNLTYKFGQEDKKQNRKKRENNNDSDSDDGFDY